MKKLLAVLSLVSLMFGSLIAQPNSTYFGSGAMIGGAGVSLSGLGFGFGGNFEYGLTDQFGVQASIASNSYETGFQKWSFVPIDLYATWHNNSLSNGFMTGDKVDTYAMAGVTWTNFSVDDGVKESSESGIGFGGGIGSRYYLNDKMSLGFEGKYRFATFEAGVYKLSIAWYSLGLNFGYKI